MNSYVAEAMSDFALRVRKLSVAEWGYRRPVEMVGASPKFLELQRKIEKIASFNEPVLITGESGSGKEALAQAVFLAGPRRGKPFVWVNCPQYMEGNLTVSELFGHKKGSFTGASSDRKGCFEAADGGVIFLDEIGDLHMSAQVMLLRALANGEFQPLGSETTQTVNVRTVAATNRPLGKLIVSADFRQDLYHRLCYFLVRVPPLRERGDDWYFLLGHTLARLRAQYGASKRFSQASLKILETYHWPGNVRELISLTTTGFALCDADLIEPQDFLPHMSEDGASESDPAREIYRRLTTNGANFWDAVYTPFMERDLNRAQVIGIVKQALIDAGGSYRRLLEVFRLPSEDYQKLMDFLRHQQLKP